MMVPNTISFMDRVFACEFFAFLQEVQPSVVFPFLVAANGRNRKNKSRIRSKSVPPCPLFCLPPASSRWDLIAFVHFPASLQHRRGEPCWPDSTPGEGGQGRQIQRPGFDVAAQRSSASPERLGCEHGCGNGIAQVFV
jgi:hypothetical protein